MERRFLMMYLIGEPKLYATGCLARLSRTMFKSATAAATEKSGTEKPENTTGQAIHQAWKVRMRTMADSVSAISNGITWTRTGKPTRKMLRRNRK